MQKRKMVLITGASGNIGREVLKSILETESVNCRILLRPSDANKKFASKLLKTYDNLEVLFGNVVDFSDCENAIQGVEYIFHFAGVLPPFADNHPDQAYTINVQGTANFINAVEKVSNAENVKFAYFGSVAEYGNRTFKHPWGRVGDPLLPSYFDQYGSTKMKAERIVIESTLKWVSFRVSGVLYDEILFQNMNKPIIFHTPWNNVIEWTTARSIAIVCKNMLLLDLDKTLDNEFWRNIYNVGNGASSRVTGFETLDAGFKLMWSSVKKVFNPEWMVLRNFHCMWFEDSNILESYLHFQKESFYDFFNYLGKKFFFFKLSKPFTGLIKKKLIEPILQEEDAPMYWVNNNVEQKVNAFFGSMQIAKSIPHKWEDFNLLCENKNPDTGEFLDYNELKNSRNAKKFRLNHGYDADKGVASLSLKDIRDAAFFRGGKCLSNSIKTGNIYEKLKWKCHVGHEFEASPFLILKGGFWCPRCLSSVCESYDDVCTNVPFYEQIWYADHIKKDKF